MTETTTSEQTPEHNMNIAEVAKLLNGVHEQTIRVWIRMKGLPCVKPGRELLFSRAEVLEWHARRRRRPPAPRPVPTETSEVTNAAHE